MALQSHDQFPGLSLVNPPPLLTNILPRLYHEITSSFLDKIPCQMRGNTIYLIVKVSPTWELSFPLVEGPARGGISVLLN